MYDREIKNQFKILEDRITKLEESLEVKDEVVMKEVNEVSIPKLEIKGKVEKVKELSEPKVVIATEEQKEELKEDPQFENIEEVEVKEE